MDPRQEPESDERKRLAVAESSVRNECARWAGQLIALGKFFRDHHIENLFEAGLRRAAKEATAEKFNRLRRTMAKCHATHIANDSGHADDVLIENLIVRCVVPTEEPSAPAIPEASDREMARAVETKCQMGSMVPRHLFTDSDKDHPEIHPGG